MNGDKLPLEDLPNAAPPPAKRPGALRVAAGWAFCGCLMLSGPIALAAGQAIVAAAFVVGAALFCPPLAMVVKRKHRFVASWPARLALAAALLRIAIYAEPLTAPRRPPPDSATAQASAGEQWTDPASGLTWQVNPTGGSMLWIQAKMHCQRLSLGGRRDWRLPTISEYRGLIRGCPATQTGGACAVTDSCRKDAGCMNEPCFANECAFAAGPGRGGAYWPPELAGDADAYWSGSHVADIEYGAWLVAFGDGNIVTDFVGNPSAVRCVR